MKKLKTWQIVLLVIFYPIGICVWIYRVWKKNKLKRDAAAAAAARREAKEREDAARLEAWRAKQAARETLKFKVVGVTFKNEDGKSRQTLLRKLHFGDAPFNSDEGVDITIERGAYQGEPAFSVFAEGHQVGNISKDDVPFFVRRWSDFVGVTSAEVYGGGTDDEGHSINYGMKINWEFPKQASRKRKERAGKQTPARSNYFLSGIASSIPALSKAL